MKLSFEISDELSLRFKRYLLDIYGTTYRVQQPELQKALELYLESKAPPIGEKKPEKEKVPPETKEPEGRKWHGGKAPYESQYPEIAARVMELWAGGKKNGGMSRDAVARALRDEGIQISAAVVDKITTRARKKDK